MQIASFSSLGPHGFHRISYTDWGDRANPDIVVCAHGLTRNARDFDDLARALSDRFRVVCPDVAGRGRSEWLTDKHDYTYPVYLADMAALIARATATLAPPDSARIHWVGTSMGGLIGMLLAAQPGTPVRRLVMNDVGPFIPKAALERIGTYVGLDPVFASLAELEAHMRVVSAPFGPHTDEQWRHLAQHVAGRREDGRWGYLYDPGIAIPFRGTQLADVDLWPYYESIRCPVLLLRGRDSDLLLRDTALDMSRRGPRARLVEFDGVGHAPTLMAADQIATVRDFLLAPS